jgi:hypothetical protein
MNSVFVIVVALLTGSSVVFADNWQEFENKLNSITVPNVSYKSGNKTCLIFSDVVVITEAYSEQVGSDVYLYRVKAKKPYKNFCGVKDKKADFALKNEGAEYFYGIHGDYLFIDSGTAPRRWLFIYSISNKKKLKSTQYDGRGFRLVGNNLIDNDSLINKSEVGSKKVSACPPRKPEEKEMGFEEEIRGTRTLELKKEISEEISDLKCQIRYEM